MGGCNPKNMPRIEPKDAWIVKVGSSQAVSPLLLEELRAERSGLVGLVNVLYPPVEPKGE
jgi:hypothetical protein